VAQGAFRVANLRVGLISSPFPASLRAAFCRFGLGQYELAVDAARFCTSLPQANPTRDILPLSRISRRCQSFCGREGGTCEIWLRAHLLGCPACGLRRYVLPVVADDTNANTHPESRVLPCYHRLPATRASGGVTRSDRCRHRYRRWACRRSLSCGAGRLFGLTRGFIFRLVRPCARIGDTFCAGLGYGGIVNNTTDGMGRPRCQRFAVAIPKSGTLEATISAALYEFDVDIVKPDGTFAAYIGYPYRSGPPAISAPVTAGSVYEIRLAGTLRPTSS
jgi:hypothetical protein